MYTFNEFCFGHKLSKNKELNNALDEIGFEFSTIINNRRYQIYFPYHGGQVRGDCYSCIFGTSITDDDQNDSYTDTVRNAKESDYLTDYNQFINELVLDLESDIENCHSDELEEYTDLVNHLKSFILNNKPEFYSVECSS